MFPSVPEDSSSDAVAAAVAVVLRPRAAGGFWVLIGRRFPDADLPEFWEFPGGKIRPGESGEECARREVEEETGVGIRIHACLDRRVFSYPGRRVLLEIHLGEHVEGVPQALGCRAARWVRRENLDCYRFPDANDAVLDRLRRARQIQDLF
jgi:mutator protein MutT